MRRPDDAGPREPDFPEECPICGAPNVTDAGELLDESHLTCGKQECLQAQEQREFEDLSADAAAERAYLAETGQLCPDCGCLDAECACVNGAGTGTP